MGNANGAIRGRPGFVDRDRGSAQGPSVSPGRARHEPRADFAIVQLTQSMPPPLILDPKTLDLSRVIADQEAVRRANAHRGQMEHLTAVVYMDTKEHIIAGYKDVR